MSSPTWPTTLTDSSAASGATLQLFFDAITTWASSTKLDRDNLQFAKTDCVLRVSYSGTITDPGGGKTIIQYVKVPASLGQAFEPVSLQLSADQISGVSTATLTIKDGNGMTLWTTSITAVDLPGAAELTSFSPASVSAGTWLQFQLVVTGTSFTDVSVTLWGKTSHRS